MTHGLKFREHYRPATLIGPPLTLCRGMSDMLYEHSDLCILPRTMVDVASFLDLLPPSSPHITLSYFALLAPPQVGYGLFFPLSCCGFVSLLLF